jgi:hypothetical protein
MSGGMLGSASNVRVFATPISLTAPIWPRATFGPMMTAPVASTVYANVLV